MRDAVAELRLAAPGVEVVVVRVPVARADDGFVPDPVVPGADSYDGLHPSPSGEVEIAASVADALAELGIGGSA